MSYRKGQYLVCRYRLSEDKSNGDIILGVISSVRTRGKINIINLLTDKEIPKAHRDVTQRNVVVPSRRAQELLKFYEQNQDKHATREAAVALADRYTSKPRRKRGLQLRMVPPPPDTTPYLDAKEEETHLVTSLPQLMHTKVKDLASELEKLEGVVSKKPLTVDEMVAGYMALDQGDKWTFSRRVWKDVLAAFGVE